MTLPVGIVLLAFVISAATGARYWREFRPLEWFRWWALIGAGGSLLGLAIAALMAVLVALVR